MHRKYPRRGLKKKMHAAYMNVFPALLGAYIDRLGAVPSKNYNPLPLVFVCGTLNYASAGADSGRKKTTNPRTHQPRQPVQRRQYESTMGPASQTAKHVKHTTKKALDISAHRVLRNQSDHHSRTENNVVHETDPELECALSVSFSRADDESEVDDTVVDFDTLYDDILECSGNNTASCKQRRDTTARALLLGEDPNQCSFESLESWLEGQAL